MSKQLVTYAVIENADTEPTVHPFSGTCCTSALYIARNRRYEGRRVTIERVVIEHFGTSVQTVHRYQCPDAIQQWLDQIEPWVLGSTQSEDLPDSLRQILHGQDYWHEACGMAIYG